MVSSFRHFHKNRQIFDLLKHWVLWPWSKCRNNFLFTPLCVLIKKGEGEKVEHQRLTQMKKRKLITYSLKKRALLVTKMTSPFFIELIHKIICKWNLHHLISIRSHGTHSLLSYQCWLPKHFQKGARPFKNYCRQKMKPIYSPFFLLFLSSF